MTAERREVPGMIDFRAHLATIVAVFLALGLGMLVGAQLADEGALAQEYSRLIEQIEVGLERARRQNRELEGRIAEAEQRLEAESRFVDEALSELLAGKLDGLLVELVTEGPSADAEGRLRHALQWAGAELFLPDAPVPEGKGREDGGSSAPPLRVVLQAGGATIGDGDGAPVADATSFRGLLRLIDLLEAERFRRPLTAEEGAL